MPSLSAYPNTENTALVFLQNKGFKACYDKTAKLFICEKDGWNFAADSITELLGLVSIYEFHSSSSEHSEYWWQINDPWLMDDLPEKS